MRLRPAMASVGSGVLCAHSVTGVFEFKFFLTSPLKCNYSSQICWHLLALSKTNKLGLKTKLKPLCLTVLLLGYNVWMWVNSFGHGPFWHVKFKVAGQSYI